MEQWNPLWISHCLARRSIHCLTLPHLLLYQSKEGEGGGVYANFNRKLTLEIKVVTLQRSPLYFYYNNYYYYVQHTRSISIFSSNSLRLSAKLSCSFSR